MTATDYRAMALLREELEAVRDDLLEMELRRDAVEDERDALIKDEERLTEAADMAHALHDARAPRRLCRQEMCMLFEDGGL